MPSSKTLFNRRDRRKAKASEFARGGTAKPKLHTHHVYENPFADNRPRVKAIRPPPLELYRTVLEEGPIVTNLGRLLARAV